MEEKKPSKTGAIIGTVAATLLCGCPGIALCITGIIALFGVLPYSTTVNGYTQTGTAPSWVGIIGLCMSVIFIVIPIVVGVLTLRKKKVAAKVDILPPSEPLPPAA